VLMIATDMGANRVQNLVLDTTVFDPSTFISKLVQFGRTQEIDDTEQIDWDKMGQQGLRYIGRCAAFNHM